MARGIILDTSLLICDHSYHYKAFNHQIKNGLQHYIFRLQTDGCCEAFSRGNRYILKSGDLLLLKPGDDYHLVVQEPTKKDGLSSGDYYLFCQGSWIDEWWQRKPRSPVYSIGTESKLIGLWHNLLLEKRRGLPEEDTELEDVLLRSLCLYIDRAISDNVQMDRKGSATLLLKRFIEEHATMTFKLEEAARYAGLSLSRAVKLFKEHYGKTMIQYAIEIRLKAAIEQIQYSEMTLEHIAETCGFASYSYFHRVFRNQFGMSPVEYRASNPILKLYNVEQTNR